MKGSIGVPGSITHIIPRKVRPCSKELSKDANQRLKIINWYNNSSFKYTTKGKKSAVLTCRHFGLSRSCFYKWLKRYNPKHPNTLENRSKRPKTLRTSTIDTKFIENVRYIRQQFPHYSAKKIYHIIKREYPNLNNHYSIATIGRIIKKYNLYFRPDMIQKHKRRSKLAVNRHKQRKPYNLKTKEGQRLIEFDMKHIMLLGIKRYAFVGISPYTKECIIHIGSTCSSSQAKAAMEKVVAKFGSNICIVNDNGSENMGELYDYLKKSNIEQYFARAYKPKDKPYVERVIGTYQYECLDYFYEAMSVEEIQKLTDDWLDDYHSFRPHESLGYKTPDEFVQGLLIV
jgi:putative transposase